MEREIKFRGLDKQGKWHYGYYAKDYFGDADITSVDGTYAVIVIPETVGQYTGLKDKNGVEIYEGDILLKRGNPEITKKEYLNQKFIVYYDQTYARFFYKALNPMPDNGIFVPHVSIYVEKIGNIHEHKHLLS